MLYLHWNEIINHTLKGNNNNNKKKSKVNFLACILNVICKMIEKVKKCI